MDAAYLGLYDKRKAGYLNLFSMPSLPKEVIMGIFDEKSKALRSEMLLKDESSSCAWLAELLILPLEQQIL